MAQTLTLNQLQAAQNLILKGDLNGFYQYMTTMVYNYALCRLTFAEHP